VGRDHVKQAARPIRAGPTEQFISDQTERVLVAAAVQRLIVDLFRRGVARRQTQDVRRGSRVQQSGNPKVQYFGVASRGKRNIFRFQIAVHNTSGVGVIERRCKLCQQARHDIQRPLLGPSGHRLPEISAFDKLEDGVWACGVFARIVNRCDRGMIQPSHRLPFPQDARVRLAGVCPDIHDF
jgi:hypothetical protein